MWTRIFAAIKKTNCSSRFFLFFRENPFSQLGLAHIWTRIQAEADPNNSLKTVVVSCYATLNGIDVEEGGLTSDLSQSNC